MGCEESKFCASKNNVSKKFLAKLLKLGLRPEEADHMFKLMKEQVSVPRHVIQGLWRDLLTGPMMDIYENYLVNKSDKKIGDNVVDIVSFSLFLSNFIKGTVEDRLDMYSSFLQTQDDVIAAKDLTEYLVQLMKSVLVLMTTREITQYIQWSKKGREFTDENIQRWASATILNVYDPHEIDSISRDKMTSWMTLNMDVTLLQCFLFYSMYELDKLETGKHGEHRTIHCPLPYLELNVERDDWKAIMSIPSVTFINSHLPTENRYQWRLAYSVDIHGEGFTTFRSLICNRGPTVLVIKDKDNHIFGGYASTSWHVGPQFFDVEMGASVLVYSCELASVSFLVLRSGDSEFRKNFWNKGDQRCFLFSLQPTMKIYPTLPHNDHFLYLNANQKSLPNGLGMGGQLGYWGLWIDASFEFGSCSPSCSTYAGYQMLSGSATFSIAGLEVWCAEGNLNEENGPGNSADDFLNKDEEAASILHKDPGARALMDMLGKTGSGRDFLDHPT